MFPNRPEEAILLQVRQGQSYIGLDPVADDGLFIRVVVNLGSGPASAEPRVLQGLFPILGLLGREGPLPQLLHARQPNPLIHLR